MGWESPGERLTVRVTSDEGTQTSRGSCKRSEARENSLNSCWGSYGLSPVRSQKAQEPNMWVCTVAPTESRVGKGQEGSERAHRL